MVDQLGCVTSILIDFRRVLHYLPLLTIDERGDLSNGRYTLHASTNLEMKWRKDFIILVANGNMGERSGSHHSLNLHQCRT